MSDDRVARIVGELRDLVDPYGRSGNWIDRLRAEVLVRIKVLVDPNVPGVLAPGDAVEEIQDIFSAYQLAQQMPTHPEGAICVEAYAAKDGRMHGSLEASYYTCEEHLAATRERIEVAGLAAFRVPALTRGRGCGDVFEYGSRSRLVKAAGS